jgi:putative ABC transport system substrate-binding protein
MKKKITVITLFVMVFALCLRVEAQQSKKIPRIGYLAPRSAVPDEFIQGLRQLGYVAGQNILIEPRFAHGKFDQFPRLATELVRLNVDVLVTLSTPAAKAAKKATSVIPIIMLAAGHPVDEQLVVSLARPGGNLTGLTAMTGDDELHGKRLELFRETVPKLQILAVLWDGQRSDSAIIQKRTKHAADLLGLKIQSFEIQSPDDLPKSFRSAAQENSQGVYAAFRHAPILSGINQLVALAIKSQLPTIFSDRAFVEAGGLLSYGTSFGDLYRRQAVYVDKILKGVHPAELPVEQPTQFELVINLKTAKQIGLAISQKLLARADKVIK